MTKSTAQHQSRDIQCGPVVISYANLSIRSTNFTSKVELKVMRVLEVLIENCGELVTRDQLHQAVWHDTHVSDDTLNRAISILRKDLTQAGLEQPIITIPRRGYRFDGNVEFIEPVRKPIIGSTDVKKKKSARSTAALGVFAVAMLAAPVFWATTSDFLEARATQSKTSGAIDKRAIRSALSPLLERSMPVDSAVAALVDTQDFTKSISQMRAERDDLVSQASIPQYVSYLHQLATLALIAIQKRLLQLIWKF